MYEAEDHHWWYVGNHENFFNILHRRNLIRNGTYILDVGCGTGKWLEILKNSYEINETGIDFNEVALEYARTRGKINFQKGDINKRIFPESSFDLITSFDVIAHYNVDDSMAIKNFNTLLNNEGYLLLTVPAYQFLHSKHDEVVQQDKRYNRKQIKLLLENNDFEIIKISYCVCLLFPLALIKRILNKIFASKGEDHNEVKIPPKIINQLFLLVMRIENFLFRYISLPFGLSVLVLAKKKPTNK
jgi:SAM-dependent methyltransferase